MVGSPKLLGEKSTDTMVRRIFIANAGCLVSRTRTHDVRKERLLYHLKHQCILAPAHNQTRASYTYSSMLGQHDLLLEALLIEIENPAVLGIESICAVRHSQKGDETELPEKNHDCGINERCVEYEKIIGRTQRGRNERGEWVSIYIKCPVEMRPPGKSGVQERLT